MLITSQSFVYTARRTHRFSDSAISNYVTVTVTVFDFFGIPVLAWDSRTARRVVRRSLGAEWAAFSTGLEHADLFRVM